jgi:hypothetical protein
MSEDGELRALLRRYPTDSPWSDFVHAVVDDHCF